GNRLACDSFGLAASREIEAHSRDQRHGGERSALGAPIDEIQIGHADRADGGMGFGDDDEAIGIGVWQGAQQDGVNDGEDGGVGADSEGDGQESDASESGILTQDAQRVANVVPGGFEEVDAAGFAASFLNLTGASEIEADAAERFLTAEAGRDGFLQLMIEVEAELVIELGVHGAGPEDGAQAVEDVAEHDGSLCRAEHLPDGGG